MYGVEVPHVSVMERNRRGNRSAGPEAEDFTMKEHVHAKTFHVGPKKHTVEATDAQRFLNHSNLTAASGLLENSERWFGSGF